MLKIASANIPKKTINELSKLLSENHNDIEIVISLNKIIFYIDRLILISKLIDGNFIQQNIYKEINITDLLKISTMSKSSFYRAFAEELGISPYQLIIDERLKISKKLLLEEKLSIKETAYASGFSSSNYFIRLFKKNEGLTPKQFMTSKLVHPK